MEVRLTDAGKMLFDHSRRIISVSDERAHYLMDGGFAARDRKFMERFAADLEDEKDKAKAKKKADAEVKTFEMESKKARAKAKKEAADKKKAEAEAKEKKTEDKKDEK